VRVGIATKIETEVEEGDYWDGMSVTGDDRIGSRVM
jgi:hypothetical protein